MWKQSRRAAKLKLLSFSDNQVTKVQQDVEINLNDLIVCTLLNHFNKIGCNYLCRVSKQVKNDAGFR